MCATELICLFISLFGHFFRFDIEEMQSINAERTAGLISFLQMKSSDELVPWTQNEAIDCQQAHFQSESMNTQLSFLPTLNIRQLIDPTA